MVEDARQWVYVTGAGRSGSTLLGELLGREAGTFNCGELHFLWEGLVGGWMCECGTELARCPVWSVVAAEVCQATGLRSLSSVAERARSRRGPRAGLRPPRPSSGDVELRRATERAVERVTGADRLVDTSQAPFTLAAAAALERPLTVVHLVRDPRGVAFSDGQACVGPPALKRLVRRRPVWKSSMLWLYANVASERVLARASRQGALDRSIRLRYEDLARDPAGAVATVVAPLPATGQPGREAGEPGPRHGVAGQPDRPGRRPAGLDEGWRRTMAPGAQAAAVAMTAPLFLRYGYGR